jgi:hypothetical protein
MAREELIYHGKKIIIVTEGENMQLTIDGEPIPVLYSKDTGQYIATKHSAFIGHPTLLELAKHVIDQVINQRRS